MKRILSLVFSLLLVLVLFTSCSGNEQQTVKYTVTYANTNLPASQVDAGTALSKPADPTKDDSLFVGWYSDAGFTQKVNFPVTVNSNMTLYAEFYSYKDAFVLARKNTIGESVPGYEYDYTLSASATYMGVALNGNANGNAKYNPSLTDVTFYDEHVNSGSLFYDGSKYTMKKARELHKISLDENNVVKNYTIEEVGEDYKYDSSSFAKAVFEFEDADLKEIKPTGTTNEYELKTKFTFSKAVALVGNYVNHPIVVKLIGELPETSAKTGLYVTFDGDKLSTYRYEIIIDVEGIQFKLTYTLRFKNAGSAPSITPKTFKDTYITSSDISVAKADLERLLNTYKSQEHSGYDYKVKTAVDYEGKLAINATIDGWTKRKVAGGSVYYLNDYEVDSDLKNSGLYKSAGLKDAHGGRVKLSNGEVHDLKKKLLGGYDDVKTTTHDDADNFYLFNILDMVGDNVTFIQKLTNDKDGTVTYAVGTNTKGALSVLKGFNNALRINPLGECSKDVKAFGSFSDSSFSVNTFKFTIVFKNGVLSEINLDMNGAASIYFPGSDEHSSASDAEYKLNVKIEVTDDAKSYEPAASVSKVK